MAPPEAVAAGGVRLEGVTHSFGGPPVLDDLDLEVHPGEVLALLGPSGCGKTTLLRVLAGLVRPDAGTVSISGEVVTGEGRFVVPERRGVGMVFQDWALFPHLDVVGNVGFALPRRLRSDDGVVADMLALVGLPGLGHRYPSELSGGQQQRVALGRALAPHPAVLLLDEPFSNLDATLRSRVRSEVRDLVRRVGVTTVLVTHDRSEAYALGDRVAVMREGRVVQVGAPEVVHSEPVDDGVAGFLGEANWLEGDARGDVVDTVLGPLDLRVPAHGRVRVMVRPEDVRLGPPAGPAGGGRDPAGDRDRDPAGGGTAVPATVVGREFRGETTRLELDAGGVALVALVLGAGPHEVGDPVSVRCNEATWVVSHLSPTLDG